MGIYDLFNSIVAFIMMFLISQQLDYNKLLLEAMNGRMQAQEGRSDVFFNVNVSLQCLDLQHIICSQAEEALKKGLQQE